MEKGFWGDLLGVIFGGFLENLGGGGSFFGVWFFAHGSTTVLTPRLAMLYSCCRAFAPSAMASKMRGRCECWWRVRDGWCVLSPSGPSFTASVGLVLLRE